jgi:hypothetical protein
MGSSQHISETHLIQVCFSIPSLWHSLSGQGISRADGNKVDKLLDPGRRKGSIETVSETWSKIDRKISYDAERDSGSEDQASKDCL